MRIHSDKLTRQDFAAALEAVGLYDVTIDGPMEHRSQSRARAFELRLAALNKTGPLGDKRRRRNSGVYGAENGGYPAYVWAATYDEHGYWMAELFERDPDAIIGYYKGVDDFHAKTNGDYRRNHYSVMAVCKDGSKRDRTARGDAKYFTVVFTDANGERWKEHIGDPLTIEQATAMAERKNDLLRRQLAS